MKLKLSSMIVSAAFLGLILNCISAFGQLAEPANDLGVRLGHIHLVVKNVEAQTKFWTEMMGGAVVKNGPLTLIQFPGVFMIKTPGNWMRVSGPFLTTVPPIISVQNFV